MRYTLLIIVIGILSLALAVPAAAQGKGGIPESLVKQLNDQDVTIQQQTMADIVANHKISDIALNRDKYIAHNTIFNFVLDNPGDITNQKSSGRCWMFAGFNVLRPHVIEKYKLKNFEFSENYLMFWDKMEKINMFLQEMIDMADKPLDDRRIAIILDNPMGDGGWWSYFVDLVNKYGVVPKEIMPETENSSSSGSMDRLIGTKAMEMGLELRKMARAKALKNDLEKRKEEMLTEVYRLLVLNLGKPPSEFTWRYETEDTLQKIATYPATLTPQSFFHDVVDLDLTSYMALFNYPGKDYYQTYALEMSRNMYDSPNMVILNLPVDSLKAYALKSVLDSTPVWFACDVGKDNYGKDGILALDIYSYDRIYNTTFNMPKKDLIETLLITPNHAMTFIGVDTTGSKASKWLVENSWGDKRGDKGKWTMYDDWFDRYMFGLIINTKYLSPQIMEYAKKKPMELPPWDPMYQLNKLQ